MPVRSYFPRLKQGPFFIPLLAMALLFLAPPDIPGQSRGLKEDLVAKYAGRIPREWGETVTGARVRLDTKEKVLALTFDACGGSKGGGYDAPLIDFLTREEIPASLFLSGRWIEANRAAFVKLASNPLFEVENHGLKHLPCSVTGRSAYGITGTKNVGEAFDEIGLNARRIEVVTGRTPRYYRSGTAFLDEVCVEIAGSLGQEVVNYSVPGDAGATWSPRQVTGALLAAPPGTIVLFHMNHPGSGTLEGLRKAIPELRRRGFRFVKVSEYGLR